MGYEGWSTNQVVALHAEKIVTTDEAREMLSIRTTRPAKVFVLTSPTYVEQGQVVGVFETLHSAEKYRQYASPPVEDGEIVEWAIESRG